MAFATHLILQPFALLLLPALRNSLLLVASSSWQVNDDLPPKLWTALGCHLLHLDRADVSDGRMKPGPIIEAFYEGEDVTPGVRPRRILTVMDELRFESVANPEPRCCKRNVLSVTSRGGNEQHAVRPRPT